MKDHMKAYTFNLLHLHDFTSITSVRQTIYLKALLILVGQRCALLHCMQDFTFLYLVN
jgi:hypothetical protein